MEKAEYMSLGTVSSSLSLTTCSPHIPRYPLETRLAAAVKAIVYERHPLSPKKPEEAAQKPDVRALINPFRDQQLEAIKRYAVKDPTH